MEILLIIALVGIVATSWLDMKKSKASAEALLQVAETLRHFATAVERASRDQPMLIASGKSARDIAQKMSRAFEAGGVEMNGETGAERRIDDDDQNK